jgi:hypothetical protein
MTEKRQHGIDTESRDDVTGYQLQWTLTWHSPVGTNRVNERNAMFPGAQPGGPSTGAHSGGPAIGIRF